MAINKRPRMAIKKRPRMAIKKRPRMAINKRTGFLKKGQLKVAQTQNHQFLSVIIVNFLNDS